MLKQLLRRSKWALAAAYLVDDQLWRARLALGRLDSGSGTAHEGLALDESIRYIEGVFDDYKRYGGVTRFHGRAAELGPGDNAGIGLLLAADGCSQVDLVDRYRSRRDPEQQRAIYEALARRRGVTPDDPAVRWLVGRSAEAHFASSVEPAGPYDIIVSRSVLEHLYDPIGCLRAMAAALAPGGRMIHKVDLRDHGMFTPEAYALKFLEIPDALYRRMTRFSGRPNRILVDQYRAALPGARLLVTQLAGAGDVVPHRAVAEIEPATLRAAEAFVEQHRHRFARSLRGLPALDLAIQGFFLVT